MDIYLVGGAVRDKQLGIEVKDRDWVVVGATPAAMRERGFKQVGRDFPVFLDPRSGEEYALARTERKSGRGHTGFTVHAAPDVTLAEDLRRRDLTINAMAEDRAGQLVDPYGGRRDIEDRLLRHVSPAFCEDPLRVLRVARFAARFAHLGFEVADDTLELMRTMTQAGELEELVAERVWQELKRALEEPSPQAFIQTLRDCGALCAVLPEVDRLFGVPQPARHHPEIDTGDHVLRVLAQAARLGGDSQVGFAVPLHDVGKGLTPPALWPSHKGHEDRGAELVGELCRRLKVPNEHRDLAVLVSRHHTDCHRLIGQEAAPVLDLLERLDAFRRPERLSRFLLACEADARGRKGLEQRDYPQAERLRRAQAIAGAIDPRAIVEAGHRGRDIGDELRRRRVDALAAALT